MPAFTISLENLKKFIEALPDNNIDKPFFEMEDHDGYYVEPLNPLLGIGFPYDPGYLKYMPEGYKPPPENFAQFVEANGVKIVGDELEYDPKKAEAIRQVAEKIVEEDGSDGPTWQRFGLHHDDDVDSYGGLILAQLDMLNEFLKK
jgi:hypothetical protein